MSDDLRVSPCGSWTRNTRWPARGRARALLESAELLNRKMREIRDSGKWWV